MWKNVYDVYIENNIEKGIQEWVNSLNLKWNNNYMSDRDKNLNSLSTFILFDKKKNWFISDKNIDWFLFL